MKERLSPPTTDLSLSEIAKLNRLVENTITVIPRVNDTPFSEQCIISAFGSDQVIIIFDEKSNSYWVRALKTQKRNLKSRLCLRSGGNFTCRDVGEDARSSSSPRSTPPPSSATTSDAIQPPDKRVDSFSLPLSGEEETSSSVATSSTGAERLCDANSQPDGAKSEGMAEELTRPFRKKARLASATESSGSTSTHPPVTKAALQLPRPPFPRFDDMPFEILAHILRLYFEEIDSPEVYVETLHKLYWLGRHPRDVINKLPELWTKVHPVSPSGFTIYSLHQFPSQAVSIYYNPKPEGHECSAASREPWQDLQRFLRLVKPQRPRWERMTMVVTPDSLPALTTVLESPAPQLRSLSVTVTDAPWSNPLALPMAPSLRAQVDRSLNLLEGKQGNLQHLELKNVPCRFNPSAFVGLISLSLAEGTRTRYTEVIAFLESSTNLRTLHLVNVRWLDHMRTPSMNAEGLSLPQLKELTLVESLEHTGMTNLLYLIKIQTCNRLYLRTLATVELLGQRLAEKVVPIVRRTLTVQLRTSLDIRHHLTLNEMSWRGRDEPLDLDGEQETGFNIGFRSSNPGRSDLFFNFVQRILDLAGLTTSISLDIHDSLSGAAPLAPGSGAVMAVPTLSTDSLQLLDIANISADVVEGYLGYVKDFLVEDLRPSFPGLGSVHLQYIPDAQAVVQPGSWAQYSLKSLLDDLRQAYQALSVEEDLFEEARFIVTFPHPCTPLMAAGRET
ncbi:hypothetical protein M407DRAFT_235064 [Tulasnella calospora MUT 4182]|uniref:Uncharacterized protein n=1 Tax=Tulasnella calospora MUT 4182 TaxID=1051891 RepID=A0A0C3PNA9_9AGAM|nr:hypothetical protein M407DRAFT_235064 [Tulasnella calospora MUT 4182]